VTQLTAVAAERRLGRAGPWLVAVLLAGAALRVVLAFVVFPGQGFAGDLRLFAQWAVKLQAQGPGSFYEGDASVNYPPAYMFVLWAVGVAAKGLSAVSGMTLDDAALDLAKLPAILADLGIAVLLWHAGRRWFGERAGLVAAGLYLAVPVTWYDCAIWGQVDAVAALPVLACLVLLDRRASEWATAAAVIAVLVKPQSAVVFAVLFPVLVRRHAVERDQPWRLLTTAGGAAVLVSLLCLPFDLNSFASARCRSVPVLGDLAGLGALYRSVTVTFDVLTANAYNVWALVGPTPLASTMHTRTVTWTPDSLGLDLPLVGSVPAVDVGAALLVTAGLLVAVPLLLSRRLWRDPVVLVLGYVVVATAFYALPTRVHERYLFPAFAAGALLGAAGLVRAGAYIGAALVNAVNLHAVLRHR
jgi:dolichyl-phosphate-mannose-protein mannosyltransferase